MPKRSADEKIKRYYNKIKKLEADKIKSLEVNNTTEQPIQEPEHIDDVEQDQNMLEDQAPENQTLIDPEQTGISDPSEDPCSVEDVIDPSLLSALGASTSDTPEYGAPVHESLGNLWNPVLKKGIPKEEKDKLFKDYLIPENIKFLEAPKLNPEISSAVSDFMRTRDKKIVNFQKQLGTGLSAVNQAINSLLISEGKTNAIKMLSDGCRVLCDLHFSFTKDRIKLITPSLEKNFIHMIHDAERDELLFGNTLADKIKASKAIEKQGQQIKRSLPKPTVSQPSTSMSSRPVHQGNWSGPPRFLPNRGGRGSFRRAPMQPQIPKFHQQSSRPQSKPSNPVRSTRAQV